jgi:hypothetical protein
MQIRRGKVYAFYSWFEISLGRDPFSGGIQFRMSIFHRGVCFTFMTDEQAIAKKEHFRPRPPETK